MKRRALKRRGQIDPTNVLIGVLLGVVIFGGYLAGWYYFQVFLPAHNADRVMILNQLETQLLRKYCATGLYKNEGIREACRGIAP